MSPVIFCMTELSDFPRDEDYVNCDIFVVIAESK